MLLYVTPQLKILFFAEENNSVSDQGFWFNWLLILTEALENTPPLFIQDSCIFIKKNLETQKDWEEIIPTPSHTYRGMHYPLKNVFAVSFYDSWLVSKAKENDPVP